MSTPRNVKLVRRRAIEAAEVIDCPWIIDTLIPAIAVSLVVWIALLVGVR